MTNHRQAGMISRSALLRFAVFGMSLLLLYPMPARAFDTGHHNDLIQAVLSRAGFEASAIKTVQVACWLTDYFSESPTSHIQSDMRKLHADDLFNTTEIENYRKNLVVNSKAAIQQAAKDSDSLRLLILMGISLHVVQDFHTHSNWVEAHPSPFGPFSYWEEARSGGWFVEPNIHPNPSGPFQPTTWFDRPIACEPGLFTGHYGREPYLSHHPPHGTYDQGLNKDSYNRPKWDEAYVSAYVASVQWLALVQMWIEEDNPEMWGTLKGFSPDDREMLESDVKASYEMSLRAPEEGHWKGRGSVSVVRLLGAAVPWQVGADSVIVKAFKDDKVYLDLTRNLSGYAPPSGEVSEIPEVDISERAIIVRTLAVSQGPDARIDIQGSPDFFALVTVEGQRFTEAIQRNHSEIDTDWTSIRFVSPSLESVDINIELWDDDSFHSDEDCLCDINPTPDKKGLSIEFLTKTHRCSGDLGGVRDTEPSAASPHGVPPDDDCAQIKLFVTERLIQYPRRSN